MTPSISQLRITHALHTYRRLREDLRQGIFSGQIDTPDAALGCPEHCEFDLWVDGLFTVNGQQMTATKDAVKAAHIRVHQEAVVIAAMIRTQRPEEAHAAFHAPAFAQAIATLIEGLEQMHAHLKSAA